MSSVLEVLRIKDFLCLRFAGCGIFSFIFSSDERSFSSPSLYLHKACHNVLHQYVTSDWMGLGKCAAGSSFSGLGLLETSWPTSREEPYPEAVSQDLRSYTNIGPFDQHLILHRVSPQEDKAITKHQVSLYTLQKPPKTLNPEPSQFCLCCLRICVIHFRHYLCIRLWSNPQSSNYMGTLWALSLYCIPTWTLWGNSSYRGLA